METNLHKVRMPSQLRQSLKANQAQLYLGCIFHKENSLLLNAQKKCSEGLKKRKNNLKLKLKMWEWHKVSAQLSYHCTVKGGWPIQWKANIHVDCFVTTVGVQLYLHKCAGSHDRQHNSLAQTSVPLNCPKAAFNSCRHPSKGLILSSATHIHILSA